VPSFTRAIILHTGPPLTHAQKHRAELLPPVAPPTTEVLAQAALYTVLRDHPAPTASPWTRLASRRFNGELYERTITLQPEDATAEPATVRVTALPSGLFDLAVTAGDASTATFPGVTAHLVSPTTLAATLGGARVRTTVVPQPPPPAPAGVPASAAAERLHVFSGGRRTTLALPAPAWLRALGGAVAGAAQSALRAPMPSVVVDVRVSVGERVAQGQALVVLESMKTETVLRAAAAGVVRAVGCATGEMVEEGRELVDIGPEE